MKTSFPIGCKNQFLNYESEFPRIFYKSCFFNLIVCKIGKCSGFAVLELVFGPGEQYLEKSSLVGTKSGIFLQCALVRGSCSVVVN